MTTTRSLRLAAATAAAALMLPTLAAADPTATIPDPTPGTAPSYQAVVGASPTRITETVQVAGETVSGQSVNPMFGIAGGSVNDIPDTFLIPWATGQFNSIELGPCAGGNGPLGSLCGPTTAPEPFGVSASHAVRAAVGETVTVTGTVRTAAGQPIPSETVVIGEMPTVSEEDWVPTVTTATTAADGSYTATFSVEVSATVVAYYEGDAGNAPSAQGVGLRVTNPTSLHATRHGRTITLTGKVTVATGPIADQAEADAVSLGDATQTNAGGQTVSETPYGGPGDNTWVQVLYTRNGRWVADRTPTSTSATGSWKLTVPASLLRAGQAKFKALVGEYQQAGDQGALFDDAWPFDEAASNSTALDRVVRLKAKR